MHNLFDIFIRHAPFNTRTSMFLSGHCINIYNALASINSTRVLSAE